MVPRQRLPLASVLLATSMLLGGACGGRLPPPKRRVIETNIGSWRFFRYQRVTDVEVYVEKNPAHAHTASYVLAKAERSGRVHDEDVVSAFVTEYKATKGIAVALVRFAKRLAQESGYVVEEKQVGSHRIFVVSGNGEKWFLWAADFYVVKVGGRGRDEIPRAFVAEYGRRYPSRLRRGALELPLDEIEPRKNIR